MTIRHFLSIADLSPAELVALLDRAAALKAGPVGQEKPLRGRSLAQGMVSPNDLELLRLTNEPAEAVQLVLESYARLSAVDAHPHEPQKADAQ